MSGANAVISGNTSGGSGGGVRVFSGASFTMSGMNAVISGNTATGVGGGGGVSMYASAQFTMSGAGARISGNYANQDGGGILCINGDFTMAGGEVSGNSCSGTSGGTGAWLHQFGWSGGTQTFAAGVHGVVYINGTPGSGYDQNSPSGGPLSTSGWYGYQTTSTAIKVLP
jgi:hypothetical protein